MQLVKGFGNDSVPIPLAQQLDNFQRQNHLGQYAPIQVATPYGLGGSQGGGNAGLRLPGYAAGIIKPPQPPAQQYPVLGANGNVQGWSQYPQNQTGPYSGMPQAQAPAPQQSSYSSGGIGGSTPFLSGIQNQLGQMFGQTPGLGFRPQQAPAPQATTPMNYSYMTQPKLGMPQTVDSGIPMRSGLRQPMISGGVR